MASVRFRVLDTSEFTEELIEAKAAESILLVCSCGNCYSTKESNKVKHIAEL